MSPETVIEIGMASMKVALLIAAPTLIAALLVGLIISVLQAATQIQEMTLTFVPKIIAVAVVVLIFGPWMLRILVSFTVQLISSIPYYLK